MKEWSIQRLYRDSFSFRWAARFFILTIIVSLAIFGYQQLSNYKAQSEQMEATEKTFLMCSKALETCTKMKPQENVVSDCISNPTIVDNGTYFDNCDYLYYTFDSPTNLNKGNLYLEFNLNFSTTEREYYFLEILQDQNSTNRLSIYISNMGELVFKVTTDDNINIEIKNRIDQSGLGLKHGEWNSLMYDWDLEEGHVVLYINNYLILRKVVPKINLDEEFEHIILGSNIFFKNQANSVLKEVYLYDDTFILSSGELPIYATLKKYDKI